MVITSYPTCAGEWPDRKKRANKKSAVANDSDDDEEAAAEELAKQAGPLFDPDYMFYRSKCWSYIRLSWSRLTGVRRAVILDEAHTIKNPTTGMHRACRALRSRYRWCLTGTPCVYTRSLHVE